MSRHGWVAVAALLGVVSGVVIGAGAVFLLDGDEQAASCPPTTAAGTAEAPATARRLAPLVFLHPRERLYPMPADCFVVNSTLKFAEGEEDVEVSREVTPENLLSDEHTHDGVTTRELSRPYASGRPPGLAGRRGFHLDLDDTFRRGAASGDEVFFGETPVYYDYEPGRHITYWLFFGFSAPGGRIAGRLERAGVARAGHEGDWEGISIELDGEDRPLRARYFAHGERVPPVPWSAVRQVEGHPVVFTALGSHASYTASGPQPDFDVTAGGPIWATWLLLADVRRQPWYGFGGAWGRARPVPAAVRQVAASVGFPVGDGDFTGPTGPPFKASPFDEPARASVPSPLR